MDAAETFYRAFINGLKKRPQDFVNTEVPEDRVPQGSGAGLTAYWKSLKTVGCSQDTATFEEASNPLWIFFHVFPISFWLHAANETDRYAQRVLAQVVADAMKTGKHVTPRAWTPLQGNYSKLINFFGILTYRSAVAPGMADHSICWSKNGFDDNHGFYDSACAECMPKTEFEQCRRFFHLVRTMSSTTSTSKLAATSVQLTLRLWH